MPLGKNGIRKVLEGVLAFHAGKTSTEKAVNVVPRHLILNCVDPRVAPSSYAQLSVGEMFLIRNAGNLFPHSSYVTTQTAATEPAVLELAFTKFNTVKQVAVCGHSDCKAMSFLHGLKDDPNMFRSGIKEERSKHCTNPLRTWIVNHGVTSLAHFLNLQRQDFTTAMMFHAESPHYKLEAYIDPENQYDEVDKLSMINSLVQIENVASYEFLRPGLDSGKNLLHAMWYDINRKTVMVFSRTEKTFIPVTDASTIDLILKEGREAVSKVKAAKVDFERETIEAAIESTKLQSNQCSLSEYREYQAI